MKISNSGVELIKAFEGLSLTVYKDVAGYPTIGYGHLITRGEKFTRLTMQQAKDLLIKDIAPFENAVNNLVKVKLTQNQFDALVSFSYNVGATSLEKSTLLRFLNTGDYVEAANQLLRWNRAGGKVVQGLINRREKEKKLFEGKL